MGPPPILDFRHIFAMLINVIPVLDQLVAKVLFYVSGFGTKSRHSFDHVHCQMKAIELVEDDHVEWSRRSPFLVESSHVDIVMILAFVGQTVNEVGVTVISKNHWPIGREQAVEF